MTEKATDGNEDTFNASDLLKLLDEFMGRRARLGGDTADIDSGQTIAAVGLFFLIGLLILQGVRAGGPTARR